MCKLSADNQDTCNLKGEVSPKFAYFLIRRHFDVTPLFFPSVSSNINISIKSQRNM